MRIRRRSCSLAATSAFAQAPPAAPAPPDPEGIPQHDLNRTPPTGDRDARRGRAAGRAGPSALGRRRALRRQGPLGVEEPGQGRARRVEGRERLHGGGEGHGRRSRRSRASATCSSTSSGWRRRPPMGESQDRGNSGVFFGGGRYEVQVLDSYENKTYPDGQAGALYGQFPPLVNACRPPGEWQAYDIVFEMPRFDAAGKLDEAARASRCSTTASWCSTRRELIGPTTNKVRTPYSAHPETLPISLQDHSHPVRFRNVWVRELKLRRAAASGAGLLGRSDAHPALRARAPSRSPRARAGCGRRPRSRAARACRSRPLRGSRRPCAVKVCS